MAPNLPRLPRPKPPPLPPLPEPPGVDQAPSRALKGIREGARKTKGRLREVVGELKDLSQELKG